MKTWNILYRGPLSSCNYGCVYCPFAKTSNTIAELRQDELALERFAGWVGQQSNRRIGILITPWGEALGHRYYREAMVTLSRLPQVYRIAVQTNLSGPLEDFSGANRETLALWTTFHPSEISLGRFVERCQTLDAMRIRYSVGMVGLREHFELIRQLRERLPAEVYFWVNAYKRQAGYYQPDEVERLLAVDPYFRWNLHRHPSAGKPCHAGETSFTVDGAGDIRRCHFIDGVIGNIYQPGFESAFVSRRCTAETCGCHIGYVHRPDFELDSLYGDGLLNRIPARWPAVDRPYATAGA